MIAADTSAVLHFLHGYDSPARFAVRAALIDNALALPAVVVTELLSGPERERRLDGVLEIASRLSSGIENLDSGTPRRCGSSHASAFTSTTTSGGKDARLPAPGSLLKAWYPFLEEPLAPLAHDLPG